ncbi:hypothetical protein HMI56_005493, partial [Coelomomyces lativittatus]
DSDDTLGSWVRSILHDCDIFASAHSTHAVSSTIAFLQYGDLYSILRSANWASCRTFFNNYIRKLPTTKRPLDVPSSNSIQSAVLGKCPCILASVTNNP